MRGGADVAARLLLLAVLTGCGTEPEDAPYAERPGEALAGLSDAARGRFLLGRALFERVATPEEGLGPLFNATRCSDCHDEPASGGGGHRIPVIKASRFENGRCDPLEAEGGDNIQQRATPALTAAGMGPEAVPPGAVMVRVSAPPLFGLGLLEAVPESVLAALADPDDADGDGVSGRLPRGVGGRAARFGRKGDAVTIDDFVDSALRFELGFTTEPHPEEAGPNGAPLPDGVDPMPDPEMDAATAKLLSDYVRFLAPPPPVETSGADAGEAAAGRGLFEEVGCSSCHTEEFVTGPSEEAPLDRRRIRPWSDMLLHDMGGGDVDVCTPGGLPGEYRTAPLWGLRYRSRFLHDGRATSVEEAVRLHAGEGAAAAAAFGALPADDRARLLRFLETL